ncbi:PfkB family carbohydrate kinase [Agromyces sp. NPDC058126]|uniref:PfkB family carbohydrate kinase n=1 Tax=Agromyces sp. NPDC058126 TaxID=3346350 RepID=UPI0036DA9F65
MSRHLDTSANARPRARARVTVIGDAHVEVHRDAGGSREFVGGRGVDAAIGLSILGDEATLVSAVGDDEDGDRIRSVLRDYGVRLIAGRPDGATARVAVDRRDGGGRTGPDEPAIALRDIPIDEEARGAIADADLVVVSGVTFTDEARLDEFLAAVEHPEVRLVVDREAPAGMPRSPTGSSAGLDRLARSAAFATTGGGAPPRRPDGTVAAVAHLLAHGARPGPPDARDEAWDDALEAPLAALAAAPWPGRAVGSRSPNALTDRGS